jgi:cytoplasmic iron level regulating protein YaaA (DUF328/UPF0246 family)
VSSYLITCSGSKILPPSNISTIDNLSFPELKNYRLRMIEYSRSKLNWERTLPAWQLYSGNLSKLYPRVSVNNWTKSCVKVKILSALFGWINHTDLIPYYDLKMDQKLITNNLFVFNIWNQFSILESFIDPTDIDLLSINYRKAISNNTNLNCIQPNIHFTDRGVQKGKWLNAQLELISCS